MKKNNIKDKLLMIGPGNCGDNLKLAVAGYYTLYNDIVVAYRRGSGDRFFLAARGPKTDISEAVLLPGRYLCFGSKDFCDDEILGKCKIVNPADCFLNIPPGHGHSIYMLRLMIAGAARIIIPCTYQPGYIVNSAEYQEALKENRLIII